MNRKISACLFFLASCLGHADNNRVQLAVWANEAIIASYTYNFKTFLDDQKSTAHYFSAQAWISYSKALEAAKLPETVAKNNYDVSAVATMPPQITARDASHWVATMPILVLYKNPQYQQQQYLNVVLNFSVAPAGQGVRGLTVNSIQATLAKPPCVCAPKS